MIFVLAVIELDLTDLPFPPFPWKADAQKSTKFVEETSSCVLVLKQIS